MPKSMFALKILYDFNSGSFNVFTQVLATGKGESLKNSMRGGGIMPAGGSAARPVANIKNSSSETAVTFSERRKSTLSLLDSALIKINLILSDFFSLKLNTKIVLHN